MRLDLRQKLFLFSSHFPILGERSVSISSVAKGRESFLLNFWATWCPPCLEELPSLEYLNRQLRAGNITYPLIATISVDEKREDVIRLLKTLDFKPSFPIFHDPGGKVSTQLGTSRFPETYWMDDEGNILYKWVGPQNWLSGDIVRTLSGTISSSSSVK